MSDYKVNFREMKSRVGIDDIAYALGYRLDRKAGIGRYIELVLGEGGNKRDTLIVSHPNDKAAQTFFRRDGSKGDVVTLIRENLSSFTVSGKDEWQKIAKVMARFANMPEPEYREDREYVKSAGKSSGVFDASRYEVKPVDTEKIPGLFFRRGLSKATVTVLSPFISLIRDRNNGKFEGYNIGFPYTDGKGNEVRGYEIRGHGGYKSKAAGTDSSSSAWVAVPSGISPDNVRSVFFCESAFDAMAFYQMNRIQIGDSAALVSLGGTFSDRQITGVMERFPNARAFDCFDNDLAGRIYGLRMMALQEGLGIRREVQRHQHFFILGTAQNDAPIGQFDDFEEGSGHGADLLAGRQCNSTRPQALARKPQTAPRQAALQLHRLPKICIAEAGVSPCKRPAANLSTR